MILTELDQKELRFFFNLLATTSSTFIIGDEEHFANYVIEKWYGKVDSSLITGLEDILSKAVEQIYKEENGGFNKELIQRTIEIRLLQILASLKKNRW
jgi:hypothetical protein